VLTKREYDTNGMKN